MDNLTRSTYLTCQILNVVCNMLVQIGLIANFAWRRPTTENYIAVETAAAELGTHDCYDLAVVLLAGEVR